MDRQLFSFILFCFLAILGPVVFISLPDWWTKLRAAFSEPPPSPASTEALLLPVGDGKGTEVPLAGSMVTALKPVTSGGTVGETVGASKSNADSGLLELADVFRFDLTPEEIIARRPRVTAVSSHLDLQGYRIPLVTGARPGDLAGAVTYYFNARHELQRITFSGTTGDTSRLIQFVTEHHGLARRITKSPGIYLYERPNLADGPTSQLLIRPAPVFSAENPYNRFQLELRLENPAIESAAEKPSIWPFRLGKFLSKLLPGGQDAEKPL